MSREMPDRRRYRELDPRAHLQTYVSPISMPAQPVFGPVPTIAYHVAPVAPVGYVVMQQSDPTTTVFGTPAIIGPAGHQVLSAQVPFGIAVYRPW